MAIVQERDGSWLLILHSSSDNSILSIDFSKNSITAFTLTSSPEETIMLKDFEAIGILVAQLYLAKPDVWLFRDFLDKHYLIYAQSDNNFESLSYSRTPEYYSRTQRFIGVKIIFGGSAVSSDQWYLLQNINTIIEFIRIPNVVERFDVKGLLKSIPTEITYLSQEGVAQANVLSARFLQTNNDSIAASVISNLPEALISNMGDVEILSYMRDANDDGNHENFYKNFKNVSIYLTKSGQLATVIPSKDGRGTGYLELFNPIQKVLWRIVLPLAIPGIDKTNPILSATGHQYIQGDRMATSLLELPNGDLLTMDNSGVVRIWQVDAGELVKAANAWKKLVGNIDKRIGGDSGDPMNSKGRQQTFVDVENLELRAEAKQPVELTDAQMELHKLVMQKRLEQINMTHEDFELYRSYKADVQRQIRELHIILESIEAKDKERIWLKNQSSGDVDDTKLIEGLTGDVNIYKRRGENDPESGFYQAHPKKIYFVFDLSASMYRFNSHDRRLDRSMEVALMIMESFKSFEHKFQYQIFGHSGDSPNIEFVKKGEYPRTEKETFKVLSRMHAHSQFCLSGDNTLSAVTHAIKDITKEIADDYFVIVLSDANIQQYKINPEDIAKALKEDERVNSFIIFIGSLQDQAEKLKKSLGSHAHICLDNKDLPQIMKSIFLASMLKV
ncbi:7144_t:CDS:10 [Dentiscutata heterogama]|uniref:7144_t:CDS:1 n=1 Tax=Dentiscutata heterogama TaxID=1316150 RepID=A0ACA9K6J7_9GLOM|nr:7144_t:CDS:10 [Dentiscutata heterogama]